MVFDALCEVGALFVVAWNNPGIESQNQIRYFIQFFYVTLEPASNFNTHNIEKSTVTDYFAIYFNNVNMSYLLIFHIFFLSFLYKVCHFTTE